MEYKPGEGEEQIEERDQRTGSGIGDIVFFILWKNDHVGLGDTQKKGVFEGLDAPFYSLLLNPTLTYRALICLLMVTDPLVRCLPADRPSHRPGRIRRYGNAGTAGLALIQSEQYVFTMKTDSAIR